MDVKSEFIKDLKNNNSLDIEMRKDLINFDSNINVEIMKLKILNSLNLEYKNKILNMKKKYFERSKNNLTFQVENFLLHYLK